MTQARVFDLQTDPLEQRPLVASPASSDLVAELRRLARRSEGVVLRHESVIAPEHEAELRELGYIE